MGGGRAGAGNGNVGQRGQIVERKALVVEIRTQLSIGDAGFDGDPAPLRIEGHHLVQTGQRDQPVGAVGDAVEAVARAEHFEPVMLLHQHLHIVE